MSKQQKDPRNQRTQYMTRNFKKKIQHCTTRSTKENLNVKRISQFSWKLKIYHKPQRKEEMAHEL